MPRQHSIAERQSEALRLNVLRKQVGLNGYSDLIKKVLNDGWYDSSHDAQTRYAQAGRFPADQHWIETVAHWRISARPGVAAEIIGTLQPLTVSSWDRL